MPTQNKQDNNEEACTIVKKKTYTAFVQILSLLLYSPMMLNAFQTLLTLGFADIRLAYYSSDYADAYLFSLLCRTAPVGLMYGLIIYYVYTALKERQFKYFVYAFLNAGIITMVNGGRYALLQVLFSAVIVLVMKQQLDKKDAIAIKKFKKRIRRGIICLLYTSGWQTA